MRRVDEREMVRGSFAGVGIAAICLLGSVISICVVGV